MRISKIIVFCTAIAGCGPVGESIETGPSAPSDPRELHAWVSNRSYRGWDAESTVLPALNGNGRRVFLARDIDPEQSPVGAAAVREMYAETDGAWEFTGWSVLVKVAETGEPEDWLFWESFDQDAPNWTVSERAAPDCVGCHSTSADIIQSMRPLL